MPFHQRIERIKITLLRPQDEQLVFLVGIRILALAGQGHHPVSNDCQVSRYRDINTPLWQSMKQISVDTPPTSVTIGGRQDSQAKETQ